MRRPDVLPAHSRLSQQDIVRGQKPEPNPVQEHVKQLGHEAKVGGEVVVKDRLEKLVYKINNANDEVYRNDESFDWFAYEEKVTPKMLNNAYERLHRSEGFAEGLEKAHRIMTGEHPDHEEAEK
jgi:hypothetical protein